MNENDTENATNILNKGGIIIFPTDTAFGIGCRMDDETAVKRLFGLRRRPETKATPVLVDGIEMAERYLNPFSGDVKELISKNWPGALTVVLRCKTAVVPKLVRGGTDKLGVRMPDNRIVLEIIRRCGVPILGPSANFHGGKTPFSVGDLDDELTAEVDYVVGGECKNKLASTVVDVTVNPWKILRQGAIEI